MKYLAGCKEDHTGQYFGGIEGYDSDSKVRTFSKERLTKLLEDCGYRDSKFYYPYPDYKLAHTIYSDEKLPGRGDLNTNLRNFDADRLVLFDETKAFDAMLAEDRFPEFSNSFIVIASPESGWQENMSLPIYAKYSNDRMEEYRVCTIINKTSEGNREVYKMALSTHANPHIDHLSESFATLSEQFEDTNLVPVGCRLVKGKERGMVFAGVASKAKDSVVFDYVSGQTLEDYLCRLETEGSFELMEEMIRKYCRRLNACRHTSEFRRSSKFDEIFGKREFKKKYIAINPCNLDMIFSNIVLDRDDPVNGKWTVLDYEWVSRFQVPIQFVIFRALYYHFRNRSDEGFALYLSRKGMDVYSLCGIDIGERMLFTDMEHAFQVYIIGGAASLEIMQVLMPSTTIRVDNIIKIGTYLRNLDTPKIYFSRGTSFSAENQITVIASVDDGHVDLSIPFDRYINSIRIDPTEYPCLLHIEKMTYVRNDGTRQDVSQIIVNGYKLTEDTYVYDTNDAQIIVEGVVQNAKSLDIRYHISMIEEPFYSDMLRLLKQRVAKEESRTRSFGQRAMRKAGIIKGGNLPEGYFRATLKDPGQSV